MPNRCPECNKFVALELEQDLEIESGPDVDEGGAVSATVRVVRSCVECDTEMREARFDLEDVSHEAESEAHSGEGHALEVDEAAVESEAVEEGGGPFKKSYFGARLTVPVRCACQPDGAEPLFTATLEDRVQASAMESLVD